MMAKRESVCQVIAAVIERDGRFLICQRPAHKRHGLLWEFPGGKVEFGETFLEAARRELKEELDLHVEAVGQVQLTLADPGSQFIVNFVSVQAKGEPQAVEHNDIVWLTLPELLGLALAPTDKRFALHLMENRQLPGPEA